MKTATAMKSLADRLRLTSMEGNRLAALVVPPHPPNPSLDRRAQRRLLYRLGREQFRDLVLLVWTAEDENKNAWREMLDYAEKWEAPTLSVAGADVLARGIPEGPEVGRLLEAVENWWIAHDFTADRAALLERLDALVAECRKE